MSDLKIQTGEKAVLIGDSITDCGRGGDFAPLGNGYVAMAVNFLTAKYPERKIEWVNKGISGDIVQGLVKRWKEDVIEEKPDWVSIAIGINNVAREQASGRSSQECLKDFEDSYSNILDRTQKQTKARLLLFEIFYILEEDESKRSLNVDPYNNVVHRLAADHKTLLVPTHAAFRQAVTRRPGYAWTTGDGVHPLSAGHALIALTFLETLGWR